MWAFYLLKISGVGVISHYDWLEEFKAVDDAIKYVRELSRTVDGQNIPLNFIQVHDEYDFNLGGRSLRRKLEEEGTSYTKLLIDAKIRYMKSKVKDGYTNLQITKLAGYTDKSNADRFFKLWTNLTIDQFRTMEKTKAKLNGGVM